MNQIKRDEVVIKEDRNDNLFSYTYELILREGMNTADWQMPLYSVRVSMIDKNGNSSQREARDLFRDRDKAISFFDMLVRNLATPIDLDYAVEDEVLG